MTKENKSYSFSTHLISGFTLSLAGWTMLKIIKVLSTSVAEQFTPEKLQMESMIWGPAIFLFAGYSWWKENKK